MRKHAVQKNKHDQCQYCEGKGYFQLLLGGSETCVECCGSGKKRA